MPRKARIDAPGALHHIIARGIARRKVLDDKERGRNNFPNYASQLQATFARSQITKILK
ncbi:MAG: hypothetical protein HGJ96_14975 [Desulfobacteraceae bacterium]|nr:hypothetical protein [Desulfobacteraceae bacterium]